MRKWPELWCVPSHTGTQEGEAKWTQVYKVKFWAHQLQDTDPEIAAVLRAGKCCQRISVRAKYKSSRVLDYYGQHCEDSFCCCRTHGFPRFQIF